MKEKLINEIEKLEGNFKKAIEFGPCFPYNLIKLVHQFNFKKCIGIEKESLSTIVNFEYKNISDSICLSKGQATKLIKDHNPEIQFYNAYRVFTTLKLNLKPMHFDVLSRTIILKCCHKIEELEINELMPQFHLLLASKVLSHCEEKNNKVIFDMISKLVKPNGIIFLKLNSEDYLPLKSNSSIKQVFNKEKCDWIKSKFLVLDEELTGEDGRREYELILKNKDNR